MTFTDLDPARQAVAKAKLDEVRKKTLETKEEATAQLTKLQLELAKRRIITERCSQIRQDCPPIFDDYFHASRYKGAHGGRGSAKSQTFARMLIFRALSKPGLRAVCIREVQKSLEQSVKRLLEDLIKHYNLQSYFRILTTHIETPGNGIIIFQGMQNHTAVSIKSLEGYDIAWVEEAQSLSERSLTMLRPTLRAAGSEIWFTWNPGTAKDPVDVFLRSTEIPPGALVKRVNYSDNPYLPTELKKEMEWDRSRDIDKFDHVWLGGYEGSREARVFKNWKVEDFETPHNAEFFIGGDWGFALDPTCALRGFAIGHTIYYDYEVYRVGCEIDDTPALFDQLGCRDCLPLHPCDGSGIGHGSARDWVIVTDSARPETISYMQRHGYPRILGARKGPGSVEEGIKILKMYDLVFHPRCIHAIDEFSSFSFKKHPLTGLVMPILQEKKNHVIDSARYAVEGIGTITIPDAEWQSAVPVPPFTIPVLPTNIRSAQHAEGSIAPPPFDMSAIHSIFGSRH